MAGASGTISSSTLGFFEWAVKGDFMTWITLGKDKVQSSDFLLCGHRWRIKLHPTSEKYPGYMDAMLSRRDKSPLPADITVRFSILNRERLQEGCNSIILRRNLDKTEVVKLVRHDELARRRSELLPSDTLTISCCILAGDQTLLRKKLRVDAEVQCKGDDIADLETLSSDFERLLSGEKGCDAKLQVGEREFPAHRAVLVARSSVFEAMFRKGTVEELTGIVEIADCDPESFGIFLHYLYCGRFDGVTSDNSLQLYVTADKYDVRQLKEFCKKYAWQNLTVENVCRVVHFADQCDEKELVSAAQSFFDQNAEDVFQTSEWQAFMVKSQPLANKLLIRYSQSRSSKRHLRVNEPVKKILKRDTRTQH